MARASRKTWRVSEEHMSQDFAIYVLIFIVTIHSALLARLDRKVFPK